MTLVLHANVVLAACSAEDAFALFRDDELVAPPLMWSEARSPLDEAVWRGVVPAAEAHESLELLERGPVRMRTDERLGDEAWRIADELGWAKTYDAEYVALARLLRCRLVTLDARLRRGTDRLGFVIAPSEF